MTGKLITRLGGRRAVVQLIPSGVGPVLWAGELRSDDDRPLTPHVHHGHADPTGLQQVLAGLADQARITLVPDHRDG